MILITGSNILKFLKHKGFTKTLPLSGEGGKSNRLIAALRNTQEKNLSVPANLKTRNFTLAHKTLQQTIQHELFEVEYIKERERYKITFTVKAKRDGIF